MKKNIAIISGGDSSEIVISLKSAEQLKEMICKRKYNAYIISIIGNEWIGKSKPVEGIKVNKEDFSIGQGKEKIQFDFAFISIHGTPGENGILQSYFELNDIAYSTGNVYSSALTFNKYGSKMYLKNFGIPTSEVIRIKKGESYDTKNIVNTLGLPCFVKPNEGGSSFGVSKVSEEKNLKKAIELAFKEDDQVLIEEFIEGREITCGIMKIRDETCIFPITEIISTTDFFDFEAKYTDGKAKEITPAELDASLQKKCNQLTEQIYDLFDCRGIVRVDFIIKNNTPYYLEVNTVPGMSKNSIIPQQIRAMHKKPKDIFSLVIENAIKEKKKNE
jgi:D-alanine-D-alanine ligase